MCGASPIRRGKNPEPLHEQLRQAVSERLRCASSCATGRTSSSDRDGRTECPVRTPGHPYRGAQTANDLRGFWWRGSPDAQARVVLPSFFRLLTMHDSLAVGRGHIASVDRNTWLRNPRCQGERTLRCASSFRLLEYSSVTEGGSRDLGVSKTYGTIGINRSIPRSHPSPIWRR